MPMRIKPTRMIPCRGIPHRGSSIVTPHLCAFLVPRSSLPYAAGTLSVSPNSFPPMFIGRARAHLSVLPPSWLSCSLFRSLPPGAVVCVEPHAFVPSPSHHHHSHAHLSIYLSMSICFSLCFTYCYSYSPRARLYICNTPPPPILRTRTRRWTLLPRVYSTTILPLRNVLITIRTNTILCISTSISTSVIGPRKGYVV